MPLARSVDSAAARGYRNVQPRRTRCAGFHRSHRIQHARAPAVDSEIEADAVAGARSSGVFSHHAGCVPTGPAGPVPGHLTIVEGGCALQTSGDTARECKRSRTVRTRNAGAWRATAASNFYYAFSCCRRPSATRCARSTRSCAWSTTFRTRWAARRTSSAAWRAGAPRWMRP